MEKDLANTQYKRLLKAEALEKKKKELAKEKEANVKQEDKRVKAVYHQLLEAEKKAKVKKEVKKKSSVCCHDYFPKNLPPTCAMSTSSSASCSIRRNQPNGWRLVICTRRSTGQHLRAVSRCRQL
jgi:hypothetical protein